MIKLMKAIIEWIRSHQVLCAWCNKEGVRNALHWSRGRDSHGICKKHLKVFMKDVRR